MRLVRPAKRAWPPAAVGLGELGLVVIAVAGLWPLRFSTATSEPLLTAVPLTSYPGTEDSPSLSPDGTQVDFQWCPEDQRDMEDAWQPDVEGLKQVRARDLL